MQSTSEPNRQLTLRLPESLLRASRRIARKRGVSVNELLRTALRRMAAEDRADALRKGFDALGADAAEADVEPFLGAQREVVKRG